LALGLFSLPALTGCGEQTGTVTGKVLFDGKPLSRGQVTFISDSGTPRPAVIDHDGKYTLQIPPGNFKITVSVPAFKPLAGGRVQQMDPAKFQASGPVVDAKERNKETPDIPPEYTLREKTPLSYTVTAGVQEHDITIDKINKIGKKK